jgi:hypothetical protein
VSEFGSGVVVPLVKMTEHFHDARAGRLRRALLWRQMSPSARLEIIEQKLPEFEDLIAKTRVIDIEEIISAETVIWANSASDHLMDLNLEKAPESLKKLREITLRLRYADFSAHISDTQWGEIRQLWKQAAMDIDEILGMNPDWGEGDPNL